MEDQQILISLNAILERLESLEHLVLANSLDILDTRDSRELPDPADREVAGPASAGSSLATQLENFIDSLHLRHFRGSELTPYWSRVRNGVSNSVPPKELWPNFVPTLVVLDQLREDLGSPIDLTSTYRNEGYNRAVGGVGDSQHTKFQAIDFVCRRGTPAAWAAKLRSFRGRAFLNPSSGANFDFKGGIGTYESFVHLDTRGQDANW